LLQIDQLAQAWPEKQANTVGMVGEVLIRQTNG
jgi:hypothetical protein